MNPHYQKYRETILANAKLYQDKKRQIKQDILEKEIIQKYLQKQITDFKN